MQVRVPASWKCSSTTTAAFQGKQRLRHVNTLIQLKNKTDVGIGQDYVYEQ